MAAGVAVILVGGLGWLWAARTRPVISPDCRAAAGAYHGTLAPDQARNAALIGAVAVRRGLPARAGTIGLATAMQESKLRNIDHGDRDSLGLFQQRPSQGWGTPAEVMDPHHATNAFYDRLIKVAGYRSMPVTDAAQRVQRSGFPQAYADHEPAARAFAAALYGQSPAILTCRLNPPKNLARQPVTASGLIPRAQVVVDTAAQEFGGSTLTRLDDVPAAGAASPVDDGSWVAATFAGTDAGQDRAWGLAHWSVASAEQLAIVEVRTATRRWERAAAAHQWTSDADSVPTGQVWIRVANEDLGV